MDKNLKNIYLHISKCITVEEMQPKTKHVRAIIISTFELNGAEPFFQIIHQMSIHLDHIMTYKFLYVLHKLLREGHEKSIPDSVKQKEFILSLSEHWKSMRNFYGPCIIALGKLINQKISFHQKYRNIPGNLYLTSDQLVNLFKSNVDRLFELSANLMDYLEVLLDYQDKVFNSLDKSRCNSATHSGQCRLMPVVQCVQDAASLLDSITGLIAFLHKNLGADFLQGHVERFLKLRKITIVFFDQSRQMEFFRRLISVPLLPVNPPNFMSEFSTLPKTRVEVLKVAEDEDEETEPAVENLLDLDFDDFQVERSQPTSSLTNSASVNSTEYNRLKAEAEVIQKTLFERAQIAEADAIQAREIERQQAEKLQRLKDMYTTLRSEHLELLRQKTLFESTQKKMEGEQDSLSLNLNQRIKELESFQDVNKQQNVQLQRSLDEMSKKISPQRLLSQQTESAIDQLRLTRLLCDSETTNLQSTPDLLTRVLETMLNSLSLIKEAIEKYKLDPFENIGKAISAIWCLVSGMCTAMVCMKGVLTANNMDKFSVAFDRTVDDSLTFLKQLPNYSSEKLSQDIEDLIGICGGMTGGGNDLSTSDEDLALMVEAEIRSTTEAIASAEKHLLELRERSQKQFQGQRLALNEDILGNCNSLLGACKELVFKSKLLQEEIINSAKSMSSVKDFYRKNHRWTEGLISASKAIGTGANVLVNEADAFVNQKEGSKPEMLEIIGREISAGTVQLVITGRVKASPSSERLRNLLGSSSDVTRATAGLIAAAKSAATILEKEQDVDFTQLSLTQTRKAEMESQVKVLQLESQLTQERRRLGELRKQHYSLAELVESSLSAT